jgi:hypothetical protein
LRCAGAALASAFFSSIGLVAGVDLDPLLAAFVPLVLNVALLGVPFLSQFLRRSSTGSAPTRATST